MIGGRPLADDVSTDMVTFAKRDGKLFATGDVTIGDEDIPSRSASFCLLGERGDDSPLLGRGLV